MREKSNQFIVMEASAGSGKTFALACRYVYLLLEGARVGEILTLTFTNKAANEMKERIAYFLQILSAQELSAKERDDKKSVLEALEKTYAIKSDFALKTAPSLLQNFYSATPKIMTIDAFLNSIVKRFCWYMGVPHNFELKEVQIEEIYQDFLSSLSQNQKDFFLSICFTQNKGISNVLEMIEKVQMNYPSSFKQGVEGDIEQTKQEALDKALEITKMILEHPKSSASAKKQAQFQDFEELVGRKWVKEGSEYYYFKSLKLDEGVFEELRSILKKYFLLRESRFLEFLQTFCSLYQKSKEHYIKVHQNLGFDDITKKCYKLLCEENVARDFFYFRLDEKISHILLDEFQDTSVMQYKLLYPLIAEILSGEGRVGERSFFVVGDQKQSIYKFRGGEGRLMEDVKHHFSLESENLDTNYRSCKEIIHFVNEIFGTQFSHYVPQKNQKNGGYVHILESINLKEQERDEIFMQIKNTIENLQKKGASLEDIAILTFCNQDVLEVGDYLKNFYENVVTEESISLDKKRDAQILLKALQYSKNFFEGKEDKLLRAELAKLIGLGIDEEPKVLQWSKEKIAKMVYEAILFYGLDSLEAQRVLEIACGCKDLDDLLERVTENRGGDEENQGLRVLTIHKSKGLEFKHLIVLDRLGGKNYGGENIICHYDENLKGTLFIKDKNRENADEVFAYVLEQEKKKSEIEKKNVLYVALTRAKESLWIMPILPSSEFVEIGLLSKEGEILCQKEWGELQIPSQNQNLQQTQPKSLVIQQDFGRQEGYIQSSQSGYKPNHIPSIKKGEAFHKALEMYLGYHIGIEEIKDFLDNHYGLYLESVEKKNILESLEKIYSLLVKEFHFSELKTEISFMVGNKLYRIDCLLLQSDEENKIKKAIVIDYKSGAQSSSYQEQMKNYIAFVKSQYDTAEVRGYLVYKDRFELVEITL